MKEYKHFVIIRFNIRASFGCKVRDLENNPMQRIFDETYLDERFELFETYTLPSLKNQTCQNFQTIVLFHKNTPEKYKDRIMYLRKKYSFEALFFSDKESFSFEQYVSEYLGDHYKYYITSRLDNDDMYADTYIEKIQEYVNTQPEMRTCILSFCRGEKYDLQEKKRYEFIYKQNHFLSMLAPVSTNILKYDHSSIEESGQEIVVLEPNAIMWTEIVHTSNVANKIQPYVKYQHVILQLERMDVKKMMQSLNIVIYGVGNIGKAVYEKIKDKYRVLCFIDEYANIQEYDGIKVLKISSLSQIQEKYNIIIAVSYDQDIIAERLTKQLGSKTEIRDIYEICNQ